jgi:hypothetical protein
MVDDVPELQLIQPALRDGLDAPHGAEEVPDEGARAVAIATVVHGQPDPVLEIARHERRVESDGERFLRDPTGSERLDALRCGLLARVGEPDGVIDGAQHLTMVALAP